MWLREFFRLFPEASMRVTGRLQALDRLENDLKSIRETRPIRIGSQELGEIERSEHWSYPAWWPKYSSGFAEPIDLPKDVASVAGQRKAIYSLFERIRHIEVVSVVLRFIFPEYFGIISPPVISLLNLVPGRNEQHPEHYLRYLGNLRKLSIRHQNEDSALRRLANVDMALWAAAHLSVCFGYESLCQQMQHDSHFQEMRLRNMSQGLADYWTGDLDQRLILADVLVGRDPMLAGLVASRCFEETMRAIADHFGVRARDSNDKNKRLGRLIDGIAERKGALASMGVTRKQLCDWKEYRNSFVHGGANSSASSKQAKEMIGGVRKLAGKFVKFKPVTSAGRTP
jgi:hypothetical protein